jgi:hypothetical protein
MPYILCTCIINLWVGSHEYKDPPAQKSYFSEAKLYATLRYATLLYASTLLYATLRHSTLLYATLRYSTLLYATLRYSTLLYATQLNHHHDDDISLFL